VSEAFGDDCVVDDGTLASPMLDETWDVSLSLVAAPLGKLIEAVVKGAV